MAARSSRKKAPEVQNAASSVGPRQPRSSTGYLVVARRYRPQTFEELVGQEHVASALKNAIRTGRVGHAYLFTGARGVGKTSLARIFAKALNCVKGPTTEPCNQCDICRSISVGEDLDVLEIDGASNRGIEEIRQLRQNVVVRPSRSRFKVYIIDEVHMLTKEAFNALLKTLEEPPEHVKFIFCTTEPNKVPVTILSRCQRFDFVGIDTQTIITRLQQILEAEGVQAEPAVLELLAQRAAGSMRDAQSLLEQLLAFAEDQIKLDDAIELLGLPRSDVLERIAEAAAEGNAERVLQVFHDAVNEGADPAILVEQLLTFLRDCLVAEVGANPQLFLSTQGERANRVKELATKWGVHRLLAGMQILDHTLSRMRAVTYDRVLAELALVRLSRLEELLHLGRLLEELKAGGEPTGVATLSHLADQAKRVSAVAGKDQGASVGGGFPPGGPSPRGHSATIAGTKAEIEDKRTAAYGVPPKSAPAETIPKGTETQSPQGGVWSQENAAALWKQAYEKVGGLAADHARMYHNLMVVGTNKLVVSFRKDRDFSRNYCSKPGVRERFEKALSAVVGQPVEVEFALSDEGSTETTGRPAGTTERLLFDVLQEPMIRKTVEIFGARPVAVLSPGKRTPDTPPTPTPEMEETGPFEEASRDIEGEFDD